MIVPIVLRDRSLTARATSGELKRVREPSAKVAPITTGVRQPSRWAAPDPAQWPKALLDPAWATWKQITKC